MAAWNSGTAWFYGSYQTGFRTGAAASLDLTCLALTPPTMPLLVIRCIHLWRRPSVSDIAQREVDVHYILRTLDDSVLQNSSNGGLVMDCMAMRVHPHSDVVLAVSDLDNTVSRCKLLHHESGRQLSATLTT